LGEAVESKNCDSNTAGFDGMGALNKKQNISESSKHKPNGSGDGYCICIFGAFNLEGKIQN